MAVRFTHVVGIGLRALAAHRLRSLLTALGIVLGVASVIVGVGGALTQQDTGKETPLASAEGPLPIEERRRLWDPTA